MSSPPEMALAMGEFLDTEVSSSETEPSLSSYNATLTNTTYTGPYHHPHQRQQDSHRYQGHYPDHHWYAYITLLRYSQANHLADCPCTITTSGTPPPATNVPPPPPGGSKNPPPGNPSNPGTGGKPSNPGTGGNPSTPGNPGSPNPPAPGTQSPSPKPTTGLPTVSGAGSLGAGVGALVLAAAAALAL